MIAAIWIWFATHAEAIAWVRREHGTCVACPDETSDASDDGRNGYVCDIQGHTAAEWFAACRRDFRS